MDHVVIRAVLDLGFRLLDTTTGRLVTERIRLFKRDGTIFTPQPRGDGIFVLVNTGRKDFDLSVEIRGYEPQVVPIRYEELDERLPFVDIHLIPDANIGGGGRYIDLKGKMPGIMSIEAIRLDKPFVNVSSYNERHQFFTLVASEGNYEFDDVVYALLDSDGASYQYLYPGTYRDKGSYNLARPLEREFTPNSNLFRILRGRVNGASYLLRVRDEGSELPYLVRYETQTEERYLILDMASHPDGNSLIL